MLLKLVKRIGFNCSKSNPTFYLLQLECYYSTQAKFERIYLSKDFSFTFVKMLIYKTKNTIFISKLFYNIENKKLMKIFSTLNCKMSPF